MATDFVERLSEDDATYHLIHGILLDHVLNVELSKVMCLDWTNKLKELSEQTNLCIDVVLGTALVIIMDWLIGRPEPELDKFPEHMHLNRITVVLANVLSNLVTCAHTSATSASRALMLLSPSSRHLAPFFLELESGESALNLSRYQQQRIFCDGKLIDQIEAVDSIILAVEDGDVQDEGLRLMADVNQVLQMFVLDVLSQPQQSLPAPVEADLLVELMHARMTQLETFISQHSSFSHCHPVSFWKLWEEYHEAGFAQFIQHPLYKHDHTAFFCCLLHALEIALADVNSRVPSKKSAAAKSAAYMIHGQQMQAVKGLFLNETNYDVTTQAMCLVQFKDANKWSPVCVEAVLETLDDVDRAQLQESWKKFQFLTPHVFPNPSQQADLTNHDEEEEDIEPAVRALVHMAHHEDSNSTPLSSQGDEGSTTSSKQSSLLHGTQPCVIAARQCQHGAQKEPRSVPNEEDEKNDFALSSDSDADAAEEEQQQQHEKYHHTTDEDDEEEEEDAARPKYDPDSTNFMPADGWYYCIRQLPGDCGLFVARVQYAQKITELWRKLNVELEDIPLSTTKFPLPTKVGQAHVMDNELMVKATFRHPLKPNKYFGKFLKLRDVYATLPVEDRSAVKALINNIVFQQFKTFSRVMPVGSRSEDEQLRLQTLQRNTRSRKRPADLENPLAPNKKQVRMALMIPEYADTEIFRSGPGFSVQDALSNALGVDIIALEKDRRPEFSEPHWTVEQLVGAVATAHIGSLLSSYTLKGVVPSKANIPLWACMKRDRKYLVFPEFRRPFAVRMDSHLIIDSSSDYPNALGYIAMSQDKDQRNDLVEAYLRQFNLHIIDQVKSIYEVCPR